MLEVVSGRKIAAQSDADEIASVLEDVAGRIRAGELTPDHMFMVVADCSNLDSFDMTTNYHGRATSVLGLLDVSKHQLIAGDILGE